MMPKNAKRLSVDVMLQRVETGRADGTGSSPGVVSALNAAGL
jgi:hypothetical protein